MYIKKLILLFVFNISAMAVSVAVLSYLHIYAQVLPYDWYAALLAPSIAFFCGMAGTALGKYLILKELNAK